MISAVLIFFSYLLGSIPFGLVLTQRAGLGDIRAIGSGNIGATNVLRTGNTKLAALTLFLDGVKGAIAVLLARDILPEAVTFCGFAVMLGHVFPLWLKFKGGKGVATAVGVLTALSWPVGLAIMATWLAVAGMSRRSSLAALVSLALGPLYLWLWGWHDATGLAAGIAALVVFTHRANIRRLVNGTEPRIGQKTDGPSSA